MTDDILNSNEYKLFKLREMVNSDNWQLFEEFINAYIFEYIDSSLPRDQLIGMKKAVHLLKKHVNAVNQVIDT